MIDDSENKDFVRIRFGESENKLFVARFIKMNKEVTRELQAFLQQLLPFTLDGLCKVRLQKRLFIQLLSVLGVFFQKGKLGVINYVNLKGISQILFTLRS